MGQSELGNFTDGDDEDNRPAQAEAQAVAGSGGDDASYVDASDALFPEVEETVEIAVMQVDYTIEGSGDEEYPVVHVFGRTAENNLVHARVLDFRPYFYAPSETITEGRLQEYDRITDWEVTDENGNHYESIRGTRLTKIYGQTPRDVGRIRDEFEHYEADILFPNRFLIDKDITSGIRIPERAIDTNGDRTTLRVHHEEAEPVDVDAEPRVNTFDIEVDDRSGFPEDGEEPIICIASHDSYDDEYVLWLYEAPGGESPPDRLDDYDPIQTDRREAATTDANLDVDIRTFGTEEAMLDAFLAYIDETDVDTTTGWNCLPEDSTILLADGTEKEIQNIEIGDRVVGSDGQTPTTAKVTNTWSSEKQIYELSLDDGTTIRSSGDHRIMIGDDDTVEWKRAIDIDSGDYVLKPRKLRVDDPVVPTLSELVPKERQRYDKETVESFKRQLPYGAVTELAEEFDVSKEVLWKDEPTVWNIDRCRQAADEYDVLSPDGGLVHKQTQTGLERELTEEELYLAGLILADGSMSTADGIRFYNTRKELHEAFPGETHLEPDGKGCYKQNVLDYARLYAFHELGIPLGNKNDVAVDLSTVYEMPQSYIAHFLAGVIDGDGHISSSITVAAENRTLGTWYVKLFKRLGVYASQSQNIVRVPDANRDVTRLKEHVLSHMRHSEKVTRLKTFEGGKSGQSENIPYALFEAETGSDTKRIGRDKHRRNLNLKRHETTLSEWEEYVFVRVTDIERRAAEPTYDIETTTHNFIADGCLVHNCDDFDVPYLLDRLERLNPRTDRNLNYERISRVNEVWRSNWQGPDVKGRVVFDLLYGDQRTKFTELESYRLDDVGERELGVGKERYPGDIGDLWEDDPERLLEYNLRDVELCVELDREQEIVAFWNEVRQFVGCKLEDATTPGDAVDMYVLHKLHDEFALPSKGQREGEEYEGGAVFDPITGVRENVSVLDLKSLYPMCMVTINASPETKVDPETYDGEMYQAPNGTQFRKEPDGAIREMVDELLSEREEKKSRRNEYGPKTPEYEQYDRQQQAVKVIMNCFTSDTEVLTPEGVRGIRELEVGDEVYSLAPNTMKMEVKPVVETHAYPNYEDELVDIQTSKIDFRVTPNHRMLVRKNDTNGITEDGWKFAEAGELNEYSHYEMPHNWEFEHGEPLKTVDLTHLYEGEYEVWVRPSVHGHTFTAELGWEPPMVLKNDIGVEGYVFTAEAFEEHREYIESVCERSYIHTAANRKWVPRTYDGTDFLEFLGWYVTEGNVYTSEPKEFGDNFRGSATTVKIAQNSAVVPDGGEDDHSRIGSLLDRLGFDYYVDDQCYQFTSKLLGEFLEETCGDSSFEKQIPEFVFETGQEQKELFLNTLIDGDGDRQPNSWRFTTSSGELRDDVLRLCTHLGKTASYNHDSGSWRIYCTEDAKNSFRMYRSGSKSTAEDGVYCVTVEDNHTLLAGRNGKFQNVGQSLYGVLGWNRFRLYDREMGAAVTATGRDVIEFTEEVVENHGYEVVYGDTDSVMLEFGDVSPEDVEGTVEVCESLRKKYPEKSDGELRQILATIKKGFELEEMINDSYNKFASEELNATEHRFEIEFEKLYRRFFQAGTKKRYAGLKIWMR